MKKENEQLKNIPEGISYDLNIISEEITDEKDKNLILETLLKLPKEIRDKTLDEVMFIAMPEELGGWFGHVYLSKPLKECKKWGFVAKIQQPLISLNFAVMKNESKHIKMSIVAHEIAHYILGHNSMNGKNAEEVEKEADDLTVEWGFERTWESYFPLKPKCNDKQK